MKKLSNNELQEVSGGWFWPFVEGAWVGAVVTYLFMPKKNW
jgi:bacteriocin-like protein